MMEVLVTAGARDSKMLLLSGFVLLSFTVAIPGHTESLNGEPLGIVGEHISTGQMPYL